MKAVRLQLEARLGRALESTDPMLSHTPTFAGDVIARYRRGLDGKAPYEREAGRRWRRSAVQFGQKIDIKEAMERSIERVEMQLDKIKKTIVGLEQKERALMQKNGRSKTI